MLCYIGFSFTYLKWIKFISQTDPVKVLIIFKESIILRTQHIPTVLKNAKTITLYNLVFSFLEYIIKVIKNTRITRCVINAPY